MIDMSSIRFAFVENISNAILRSEQWYGKLRTCWQCPWSVLELSWTYVGQTTTYVGYTSTHVLHIAWHMLDMLLRIFSMRRGHILDMWGLVLDMPWGCLEYALDMLATNSTHLFAVFRLFWFRCSYQALPFLLQPLRIVPFRSIPQLVLFFVLAYGAEMTVWLASGL